MIFVALAIAWAAYLVPKALEHHDAGARSRTVSTFSERIRVLARREAISRRKTALVTPKAAAPAPVPAAAGPADVPAADAAAPAAPADELRTVEVIVEEVLTESLLETTQSGRLHLPSEHPRARRTATLSAARRRRRVLGVLVFLFAAVAATAAGHVIDWLWLIAPAVLVAAWLVACRLMVRSELSRRLVPERTAVASPAAPRVSVSVAGDPAIVTVTTIAALQDDDTADLPAIAASNREEPAEGTWEPVQAPLPTYVSKTAAPRRTVTTIDLDSTGVWTSGRTDADAALAREADAARTGTEETPERRASGA